MKDINLRAWDKEEKKIRQLIGIGKFEEEDHGSVDTGPCPVLVETDEVIAYYKDEYEVISPLWDFELIKPTGLKDKENNEIYEGHVLEYGDERVVVIWDPESAAFMLQDLEFPNFQSDFYDIKSYKIVGHVLENPELAKKKNGGN